MTAMIEFLIAAALLVGCILVWRSLRRRRASGEPPVAYEPRRPVPWDLPVVGLVMFVIWLRALGMRFVEQRVAAVPETAEQLRTLGEPGLAWTIPAYARPMFQAAAASQLLTGIVVALFLVAVYRATRSDFGFSTFRGRSDLRLGVGGFFALAVPALLLQGLLQWLLIESQHPIILAFKSRADWGAFFWATIAAVAVAPPVEEFLFRGVLQGLFERLWDVPAADSSAGEASTPTPTEVRPSAAPIVISAAIFALVHLPNIDVVPLFFLSLGLGYLYRQTHRLWPGIVVHALLNAFSMAMLLLQMK